jgi:hypothetical protein
VGQATASAFARWNFRRNLIRQIGEKAGAEAHHIFPHALRKEFAKFDIDVNNPLFGAWWEKASHRAAAAGYNREWRTFLTSSPTREQIFDFARALGRKYGFETQF